MCGIVGFVGAGNPAILERMADAIRHRGPDGAGYLVDPGRAVHLGHRRLAILDIAGGVQPMHNEDDTVAVVFNGEIYNHVELRRELIAAGHRFASDHSDTEVLVHGYEEWGEDLPRRLNGMFAFAIYDKVRGRLFLARDRFGEKPLFVWRGPGVFGFASEMGALRRHPGFDEPIDTASLRKYFAYGFVPSPHCLWRNCSKLTGGTWLLLDIASGRVTQRPYWTFALEPDASFDGRREEEVAEELRGLFESAVTRRLISDVPLGVFLSGGIDSSATLAVAARHVPAHSMKTFTIGFEEPSFDESAYARTMARHAGSHHQEEILSIDRLRECIGQALSALDEPIADPSIVPMWLLARFARKHVTVALSGDGGDELFAGYDPFKALQPASLYSRVMPPILHGLLRHLAGHLPRSTANMSFDFKLRRTLAGLSYPEALWNPVWLGPVEPRDLNELFNGVERVEDVFSDTLELWERNRHLTLAEQTLMFYTRFYLQDNILVKVDRAAMAASLESRAVFLDNDLVDFCRRLPYRLKYRDGRGKHILRKCLSGLVPGELLGRRKKGFGVPVAEWLRTVPAQPPLAPLDGADVGWARERWREHRELKADHRIFLWSWLSAQSVAAAPISAT